MAILEIPASGLTAQHQAILAQSILDPVLFCRNLLQTDPWRIQEEILRSIAAKPKTVVRACHSSGKTKIAACAALWWLARFEESIVVTTAPTMLQVQKILWGEIHGLLARSLYPFPEPLQTELKFNSRRFATGFATSVTNQNEGVRFQGFHSPHLLIITDEAPGIDPQIFSAIEGARAGGHVSVLMLGNPTIASGPFYDAFHSNRDSFNCISISALDTPNLDGVTLDDLLILSDEELDRNPWPYLTTRRWVLERYHEWGPTHPLFQSRVLGEFPTQSEEALISLAWLEAAKERPLTIASARVRAGLDCAGPGEDETVLTIRRGPQILSQKCWPHSDPRGEVVVALNPFRDAGTLESVNVDPSVLAGGCIAICLTWAFQRLL